MTSTQPLDWIKQVDAQLRELDEKPQFGLPAPFNWKEFEEGLRHLFNKPQLVLTHETKGWITAGQLFSGLGEPIVPLTIECAPLPAPCYFIASELTVKELMAALFVTQDEAPNFYEADLVDGFYSYFGAELLRLLTKHSFMEPLSPRLGPLTENLRKKMGEESSFAIDLSLQIDQRHLWGRLLLPESFRMEWKSYFAQRAPSELPEALRHQILVDIGLEVGHSRLRFEEWQSAKTGDFVILDHCSYDPTEHKGSVVLTLQQKPILRGRLKEGSIKITQYPIYEEVREMWEDEPTQRSDNSEHGEEENLYGDLADIEASGERDEELFGTLDEEDETKETGQAPAITPEQLPVQLTVEVGRLKMTAAELMKLAPGNLLDLHVAPEQGVDLVLNGKKVGRGELIRMGDLLGVRILSL